MIKSLFSKLAWKRTWFILVIILAGWAFFVNFLFLAMQYAGVYVVLFDPFAQTFDEVSWTVFFFNAVIPGFVIVNYIKKFIRSYKNKGFSEKK